MIRVTKRLAKRIVTGLASSLVASPLFAASAPVMSPGDSAGSSHADAQTLEGEITQVEHRGQGYLDAGFQLYDYLMDHEGPFGTIETERLGVLYQTCGQHYRTLSRSIARLKVLLNEKGNEGSTAPPAAELQSGRKALEMAMDSFLTSRYGKPYPPKSLGKLGALLEGEPSGDAAAEGSDASEKTQPSHASIPPEKRDALSLLDHLREVAEKLAYISNDLTVRFLDGAADAAAPEPTSH